MIRVLLLTVALLASACKRERRELWAPGQGREARATLRESELIPGSSIIQPPLMPTAVRFTLTNPYEGQSYAISEGEKVFGWFNCSGCHSHGGGGMGPALMDDSWIYGSAPNKIYESIARGRPNGMPAFGGRIPDYQIWFLVTYIRSLADLQPATTKPARGDEIQKTSEQPRRAREISQ